MDKHFLELWKNIEMKKIRRITSLLLALSMVGMMLMACGNSNGDKTGSESGAADTATLILVDQDSTEYTYTLEKSVGMDFRSGLLEEGLVKEEDSASFMIETIDGHTAPMAEGVLWLLCDENKEQIQGLFEEITIESGKTYYAIYTVAPNFDD